jgi:DNA-binding response OmpR family regulator
MAKILIVEDDRFLRELIARKLRMRGTKYWRPVDGEKD